MSSNNNCGRLCEYASAQTTPIRVDAEKGILYDVLILGHHSRNRADYSQSVMQEAVGKYDGVPVYIGHTRDDSNPEYDRKLGVIRNPRVTVDGIRADLHYPPKHRIAEQLAWDAVHAPHSCGFSHDADCEWSVRDGRKMVSKISRVYSVDLVTRPATTRGLTEQEQSGGEPELLHAEILRPAAAPDAVVRSWESAREKSAPHGVRRCRQGQHQQPLFRRKTVSTAILENETATVGKVSRSAIRAYREICGPWRV